jgi:hypothetical protein
VDIRSPFILTTPAETTPAELAGILSIDNQPSPVITQNNATEFTITPVMPFSYNSLIMFRISRDWDSDITWAFQTAARFQINSVFPAHQSTFVPVDTGIELTFSTTGFTPVNDHFSISPNVRGRFQVHKNTVVFVPASRLDYETVYTVTITAGIRLAGTDDILTEDLIFSFETEGRGGRDSNQIHHAENLSFYTKYTSNPQS